MSADEEESSDIQVAYNILLDTFPLHETVQLQGTTLKRLESSYWAVFVEDELTDVVDFAETFNSARVLLRYLNRLKEIEQEPGSSSEAAEIAAGRGVQ